MLLIFYGKEMIFVGMNGGREEQKRRMGMEKMKEEEKNRGKEGE